MAVGSYTLEQEKKKLLAQQQQLEKKAADTGKAAGIGGRSRRRLPVLVERLLLFLR